VNVAGVGFAPNGVGACGVGGAAVWPKGVGPKGVGDTNAGVGGNVMPGNVGGEGMVLVGGVATGTGVGCPGGSVRVEVDAGVGTTTCDATDVPNDWL